MVEDLDALFLFGDYDIVWITKHRIKGDSYFTKIAPVMELYDK